MIKPGSIVVILESLPIPIHPQIKPFIKWLPVTDEKTPYIVRDMIADNYGGSVVSLEEGVVGHTTEGAEICIDINYVREILPPEDISEFVRDAQENYQLTEIHDYNDTIR